MSKKAYVVTIEGRVYRDFLVYGNSVAEVWDEARHGDRDGFDAMDDSFEETRVHRPRREPLEDQQ